MKKGKNKTCSLNYEELRITFFINDDKASNSLVGLEAFHSFINFRHFKTQPVSVYNYSNLNSLVFQNIAVWQTNLFLVGLGGFLLGSQLSGGLLDGGALNKKCQKPGRKSVRISLSRNFKFFRFGLKLTVWSLRKFPWRAVARIDL